MNYVTGWRGATLLAMLVTCMLAVGACGDSDSGGSKTTAGDGGSSSSKLVAEAKAEVEKHRQPVEWTAPGPAFDAMTSQVRGKRAFFLVLASQDPYFNAYIPAMKEAAETLGLDVTYFDGKGKASEWSRGLDQALSQDYDVIINGAVPTAVIETQLRKAKAKGIKVINFYTRDGQGRANLPGITDGDVEHCQTCFGRLLADFAIADSDANVNGVVIQSSELELSKGLLSGLQDEFKRVCPDTCTAKVVDIGVADWQTKPPLIARTTAADRSVNYMFPLYDGMAVNMVPAIVSAGAADRIKIVTNDGNVGPVKFLSEGSVVAADVGQSIAWNAWATADQVARVLSGEPPSADAGAVIASRVFDATNVGELDLDAPDTWYGPLDFAAEYKQLWGDQ